MTDTNLATLRELVGECRKLLENDLCDLVEELGPTLADETRALAANTSRDHARRNACLRLHNALHGDWIKLTPVFRDALARRAAPVKSGERPRQDDEDLANLHILGDDELKENAVMLRDLEKKNQQKVPMSDIVRTLKNET